MTVRFQSTLPRGERRRLYSQRLSFDYFNPRSHEGSDIRPLFIRSAVILFQSTLPRGERLEWKDKCFEVVSISIHAPTRGATLPRSAIRSNADISIHAPTRGATASSDRGKIDSYIFQSTLPRGERRCSDLIPLLPQAISIHAPTRGATDLFTPDRFLVTISIHAPTRGATPIHVRP